VARLAFPYDVSLDGRRILAVTEPERTSSTPLTLVQNWTAMLKKEPSGAGPCDLARISSDKSPSVDLPNGAECVESDAGHS
jgi:hypothetical protein